MSGKIMWFAISKILIELLDDFNSEKIIYRYKIWVSYSVYSLIFICVYSFNIASASAQIIPITEEVTVSQTSDSGVNLLHIAAPNEAGISVNYFSKFLVDDRELNIVNVPRVVSLDGEERTIDAARLTVIIADQIFLDNVINLLGPSADILFLSTAGEGSIHCHHCELNNFHRISLVTASLQFPLDDNTNVLGLFTPTANASITIDQLSAPGSLSLDVHSKNFIFNGGIDTHQEAVLDADGGYIAKAGGDLTIGTGSTNLLLGNIVWDYAENQIHSVSQSTFSHTLGGHIRSSAIKISSADDLVMDTSATTSANLLASVSYGDGVYIPQEGIEVQTFADSSLTINGDQKSDGRIVLRSTGDLSIAAQQANIDASQIEIIAGKRLSNVGELAGSYIDMAGDQLINQGGLQASVDINLWADKQLSNQYGGSIKADTVRLQSMTQAVRNGSRTPHVSQLSETNYLFDLANYTEQLDPTRLGTYYSLEEVAVDSGSYVMAANSSAHIVANRIEVQAQAFENINPYFEKVDNPDEVTLQRKYVEQVSVSAEDYLGIAANQYVLNSSAHLVVNQPDGLFEVSTGVLTNERYRSLHLLKSTVEVSQTDEEQIDIAVGSQSGEYTAYSDALNNANLYNGNTGYSASLTISDQITSATLGTRVVSYSPPALLISMGDLNVKSSQSLINNTSYVEIFGNAILDTPLVNDIGMEMQDINQSTQTISGWVHGKDVGYDGDFFYTQIDDFEINKNYLSVQPSEMNSLFFVAGDLQANAALGWFRNHKPLDVYIEKVIDNVVDTYYPGISLNTDLHISSIEEAKNDGIIKVGDDQYSLFDEMNKLYEGVTSAITQFLTERDWW